MSKYIGIDTSNYTTSVCIYDDESDVVVQKRRLLPVKSGQLGLRQSDAVFHHTQQLPTLFEELFDDVGCTIADISAVGASFTPRSIEGSYMPCFTVGSGAARMLSASANKSLYDFSHQQGHIAAALYSIGRLDLLDKPFIAFHVSGGTTEALLVNSLDSTSQTCKDILPVRVVGKTLDLNAGQLVDRVGLMLELAFPCGKELERLALDYHNDIKATPTLKGCDCCLSGVENICKNRLDSTADKSYVAALCLKYIEQTLYKMTHNILNSYGDMPVVFAGGVMSNSIIREYLTSHLDCFFAKPEFSTDNASGIAVLTAISHSKRDNI